MTSDCCVFNFFWRAVDGEHLMRFQSETSFFKFIRDKVDLAFDVALQVGGMGRVLRGSDPQLYLVKMNIKLNVA